jgi:hypothetical protein
MVKIINEHGDIKTGKQGQAVYQGIYGRQMRRVLKPKSTPPSKAQVKQQTRFQEALSWRATLPREARIFLEGYAIAHGIVDTYRVPLTWDKFALKIALETPIVRVFVE